ncbi:inner membrane protein PPF-1, chloroplastic [Selaginella moellendorffii]|nr:inner membrane protein PPF-1, chloroplastic [Selaginella moellendorffii]|eukprot:XP_002982453.2 inner membrane protein PPF-1, chloroplastic [Selaginella moellendorffii]
MATLVSSTSAAHSLLPHGAARRSSHSCCSHRNSFFGAELDRKSVYYKLRRSRSRRELRFLVSAHLGQPEDLESALDLLAQAPESVQNALARVEGFLYTVADAAVATDVVTDSTSETVQQAQQSDWFSGVTTVMEAVLKVLKDGLTTLKVPYAYGFAIILLTVLVKVLTFPLTKSQAESTISMQNLQPKLKAIQQRYAGDQERIQMETARLYKQAGVNPLAGCLPTLATLPVWIGLYRALSNVANEGLLSEGFFWIPSLAGPTTIAARQSGSGISWLFPFVDGHPPLGWGDTIAYLVLPVLLIGSQYASMQIMQPPQTDPSQKNTQLILKFLPLMIGYFALSVPSGLSLYWLTNNILSTGQQVWLRKLGGAKPVVASGGGDIISAGQAKRSTPSPPAATVAPAPAREAGGTRESRRGERFRQLKAAESKRKAERAEKTRLAAESTKAPMSSERKDGEESRKADPETSDGDESSSDEDSDDSEVTKGSLEELYASSGNGAASNGGSPNKSKRSKRKRSV